MIFGKETNRIMTAKELARMLGVSPALVSMALNGKPGVNEETRKIILEAAKQHHVSARALSAGFNRSVCLIRYQKREMMLSSAAFENDVLDGVEKECAALGFGYNQHSIYGIDALIQYLKELSRNDTAGIILMASDMILEDFRLLPKTDIPMVLLDNHAYACPIDTVKIDNISSAFSAVNFLINRTKTLPGYLRSSYVINNFLERSDGYAQAAAYNGMTIHTAQIHDLLPSIEGAYSEMTALLKAGLIPARGYFADNDLIAIGAMQALQDFGFRVPEDVSIIGFDDIGMSAHTNPPLSTMHVPKHHFGAAAVKRLSKLIRDSSLFPIKIEMTAGLVVRGTIK